MALFFHGASRFPECVKIPRRGFIPRRGIFCAHFPVGGRIRRLFSRRACILLSNESEGGRRRETAPLCDPDHAHHAAAVSGCACGADARQRKHRTNGKTTCGAGSFLGVSKDLVEFRRRSGERKSKHFLRRHVRRRKYFSACKRALCPPRADRECAAVRPQTPLSKSNTF